MQTITPLTVADFKGSTIVIGKVEIDIDGAGTYVELPDVKDFGINTNIEDEVSRFCAYSFSLTCLNTNKRYFSWNTASAYYNFLKQGRRIKIYAGIKSGVTNYYYQWIIGRVDNYSLSTVAGEEVCSITGRDFMRAILDYKLFSPNTYWGATQTFDTVASQADYPMEATITRTDIAFVDGGAGEDTITTVAGNFVTAGFVKGNSIVITGGSQNNGTYTIISVVALTINVATASLTAEIAGDSVTIIWDTLCTGLYIAYLDSISPYDGSHLTPIYVSSDFGYVGATNKFTFLADKIPSYAGTNNLVVYYFQAQSIEIVVGHILYLAGIFATTGARDTWLANASYITPTGIQIDRTRFTTGTSAFEAIRLLAEVAQYRFYFDYSGNPIFKPKASIGTSVDTFSDDVITNQDVEEDVEEVYNHIIVIGETRETLG